LSRTGLITRRQLISRIAINYIWRGRQFDRSRRHRVWQLTFQFNFEQAPPKIRPLASYQFAFPQMSH
ncbi:MAG: hypothetical protein P4L61_01620, partial [Candidatus Pacebacteria bacterium]|nr:hypothetical protein [Candidatus Paceibacterota bacterium]